MRVETDHVGWFDWEDTYREWVRLAPLRATIVEVGVCFGKSLAFLAHEAIRQGRDDLQIVGIDPWIPEDWLLRDYGELLDAHGGFYEAFVALMRQFAPAALARVTAVRQTSLAAAKEWRLERPWAVYIDGDHSTEAVRADIAAWLPLVAPGGALAGHDFGGFGVAPAVEAAFGTKFSVRGSTWLHQVETG